LIVLVAVAAGLYTARLENVPIHLHYDEVLFGLQAHAIAETGHDTNRRFLPLYFQVDRDLWYQPIAVYASAVVLKVMPVSAAALRLATVVVGLINVTLLYFIAWHLFRRESWALVAAALLALTPAHLIHSRLALDYLYPLPFVLTWLLCLLEYLRAPRLWLLFLGGTALGAGFYSYIASVAMMPVYVGLTSLLLVRRPHPWRTMAATVAGFAWPLVFLAAFLFEHSGMLSDFQGRYGLHPSTSGLDPLQTLRAAVNSRTVADRSNLYYNFFSPGFLFVSGGNNVTNSTREAGVFLFPFAVFLAAGCYDVLTRRAPEKALILLGVLTAPLAACIVPENYAIDRALALLPFGVLLGTFGIERLWTAPCHLRLRSLYLPMGVAMIAIAVVYTTWTLVSRGVVSHSPPFMILAGLSLMAFGWWTEKTQRWWPVVVALFLLCAVQFQYFYRDYLGDYGARSAAWFGNNVEGAIARVVALDSEVPAPAVLLTDEVPQMETYWRFYLQVQARTDLVPKGEVVDLDKPEDERNAPDTLLLSIAEDTAAAEYVRRGAWTSVATATDPNDRYSPLGPGEHVTFVIYRKNRPVQ
jgi:4-amino-4-deoxy-L-arabinose transferase-like glycosyltransferase